MTGNVKSHRLKDGSQILAIHVESSQIKRTQIPLWKLHSKEATTPHQILINETPRT